ncbi:killer cell lectin-like receptor subfamily G member 1 [Molossus nigricans]
MEMIDNAIYSELELSTALGAQENYRPQQKGDLTNFFLQALSVLPDGNSFWVSEYHPCSSYSACASCPSCPDFWTRYGDHCYYFSVEKDWNSSLQFCLAKDSQLLIFTDNQEMNMLKSFFNKEFYWVGLRNNSGWRWEDGSTLNSRILSNSVVQKCGAINIYGLRASSCELLFLWVCKKDIGLYLIHHCIPNTYNSACISEYEINKGINKTKKNLKILF